jgi:ABC-type transporter Mla MlaB component
MVTPIVIELLELKVISDSRLELSGTLSSDTAQAKVSQHFQQVHARLSKDGSAAFEIDVRGLKLANSSAIRLFVDWISSAAAAGYRLIFHVDRNVTWHRLSFDVLKSLAPDTVEVVGLTSVPPSEVGGPG